MKQSQTTDLKLSVDYFRNNIGQYIFSLTLFVILIVMCFIFYLIKKESQIAKNRLFLAWLSVLNIILIVVFYHIFVSKFDYLNDMVSHIDPLEKTVNRHNRELNALRDNTEP